MLHHKKAELQIPLSPGMTIDSNAGKFYHYPLFRRTACAFLLNIVTWHVGPHGSAGIK